MAKTATLVDDFAVEDTDLWTGWGEFTRHVDGQVHLGYRTSAQTLQTPVDYDLTDSFIAVELVSHTTTQNNEGYLGFGSAGNPWTGDQYQIAVFSGNLACLEYDASENTFTGYNAETMRWLRLRHEGDTIYWETAPEFEGPWTVRRSKTPAASHQGMLSAGRIKLMADNWSANQESFAVFDNVNGGQSEPDPVAEIAGDLPVTGTVGGAVSTPVATVADVAAALPVAVDLAGTLSTPTATVGELAATLPVAVDFGGTVSTPSATVVGVSASLPVHVEPGGAVSTPTATVAALTGALPVTVDLAGTLNVPTTLDAKDMVVEVGGTQVNVRVDPATQRRDRVTVGPSVIDRATVDVTQIERT